MRGNLALFIAFSLAANLASAAPISVAGFTFDDGERAFADDAFLASGSGVRFNCTAGGTAASSFADALSGSDVTQCVNVSGGGDGIVEVVFADNAIQNDPGPDLVIFEVSGPQTTGTADPRERFEVSIFDGSGFSSFVAYDPIATGFGTPDPTLDVFAVEIDLSLFGIAAGERVDRLRLHLFDNGLGSKGADIAALGALHSAAPIPEPSTFLLMAAGLAGLSISRRRRFSGSLVSWLAMCAVTISAAAPAARALPLVEAFDIETSDATDGSYPDFSLNVGTAAVSQGFLELGGGVFVQRFTRPGFNGDLTISGQIQAETFGDWNVGMEFGDRRFIFHPGFAGGAFRIEDAALGSLGVLVGSLDMGFTPSTTAFHTMQLAWEQSSNRLTVTVFDGEGLSEPFVFVWSPDGGFDPSGRIGFTYHDGGGAGPGIGLFDNLTIVPEPSTGALVCLGLGGLAVGGRTRARSGRRGKRPETEQTGAVWRLASSENTVEKLRLLN